jgi:hypothetical protein
MRRVLQFFKWRASWWMEKEGSWSDCSAESREALDAYAYRQAFVYDSLHDHFQHLWRFVPEYVRLGVDCVEGEDDGDDDDDDEEYYTDELVL